MLIVKKKKKGGGGEEEVEESGLSIIYPEDYAFDYGVDQRDAETPDSWIRRHPCLIRLTGRHPFNSEAPLSRLMEHGFLTPTSLHYVRNHGYVPRAMPDALHNWTVKVSGRVRNPMSFTVYEIINEFKPRELPVTLVCAGNRRKEQNIVKQTKGFNWGPSAISTSVWKGARLVDVLRRCGVYSKKKGALYVCFEGEEILPGGGASRYGTSISIDVALDESCDVLVAYSQNGNPLEPDHGFPVRVIIPGYIGGRMVKWLRHITVSSKESDNHYHFYDNRVLPSHVDEDMANSEDWWHRPEYVINELNINSVITTPAHGESLTINMQTLKVPYTLHGYAYSGGGRKVIRVEVSMDRGETWLLCHTQHPEKPTKYGKYWCWCFWDLDISAVQLLEAKELAVRAWDASMNTQPQQLTWNVMGMMNNCWFTVRINSCRPEGGGVGLSFEHPVQPGNLKGGWMVSSTLPASEMQEKVCSSNIRLITSAELKQHNTRESAWIVVHDSVYDCTSFLKNHPGGSDSILINAGMDCTEEFDEIHSSKAKVMLEEFKIGEFASFENTSSSELTAESSMHRNCRVSMKLGSLHSAREVVLSVKAVALSPTNKISCKLIFKRVLTHNTRLFRFALPTQNHVLGLPVGKHIFVSATIGGRLCMRPYTPTSSDEEVGYFELMIKVYHKGAHPKFPLGGRMSQYLESLKIGDSVNVRGPAGHIHYIGNGNFTVEGKPYCMKKCVMLAGGTGITPMFQVIRAIVSDPEDKTEVYLVFANRTEDGIMLRTEIDKFADEHENLNVWYVIERAINPKAWKYSIGFIDEEIMRQHLPKGSSSDISAFMCGPLSMIQFACYPNLEKLGYDKSRIFEF
ncbi:hypothetical protein KP509_26G016000 [Ceratopteris richardii]|uniref:Nitrate reductase n=1 Tax=Ceratopteris richardii TaxID=49495 RepID=A0A8T2RIQ7_CERRI|nr:hypothetical protein KP509_26G016000 [Ceratopteris richardii]